MICELLSTGLTESVNTVLRQQDGTLEQILETSYDAKTELNFGDFVECELRVLWVMPQVSNGLREHFESSVMPGKFQALQQRPNQVPTADFTSFKAFASRLTPCSKGDSRAIASIRENLSEPELLAYEVRRKLCCAGSVRCGPFECGTSLSGESVRRIAALARFVSSMSFGARVVRCNVSAANLHKLRFCARLIFRNTENPHQCV